jgi:hypothetical protein
VIRLIIDILLVTLTIVPSFFALRYLIFADGIADELASCGKGRFWRRPRRLRILGAVYLVFACGMGFLTADRILAAIGS